VLVVLLVQVWRHCAEARVLEAGRREKHRAGVRTPSVPQTDTGRRGEKPKVLE